MDKRLFKALGRPVVTALMAAAMMCAACSDGEERRTPASKGLPSELLLVVDKELWATDLADTLRMITQGDVPGLMQHEDYFRTVRVFTEDYRRNLTTMHSKLYVRLNPSLQAARIGVARDVSARPQIEVTVEGPDAASLRALLSRATWYLRDMIGDFQLGMRRDAMGRKYSRKVADDLREVLGMDMKAPANIVATKKGRDFLWGGSNLNEKDLNVVVYTYPWTGGDALTVDGFVSKRDSVMRQNIPGSNPGQWMETVREGGVPVLSARIRTVGGRRVQEVRGLWQMRDAALGGPFVSVSTVDTASARVVTAEGFVYSPGTDKRDLVRQLEAAVYSLQF